MFLLLGPRQPHPVIQCPKRFRVRIHDVRSCKWLCWPLAMHLTIIIMYATPFVHIIWTCCHECLFINAGCVRWIEFSRQRTKSAIQRRAAEWNGSRQRGVLLINHPEVSLIRYPLIMIQGVIGAELQPRFGDEIVVLDHSLAAGRSRVPYGFVLTRGVLCGN